MSTRPEQKTIEPTCTYWQEYAVGAPSRFATFVRAGVQVPEANPGTAQLPSPRRNCVVLFGAFGVSPCFVIETFKSVLSSGAARSSSLIASDPPDWCELVCAAGVWAVASRPVIPARDSSSPPPD